MERSSNTWRNIVEVIILFLIGVGMFHLMVNLGGWVIVSQILRALVS